MNRLGLESQGVCRATDPTESAYLPAMQTAHAAEPAVEVFPFSQSVQDPDAVGARPARQLSPSHVVAPEVEVAPSAHAVLAPPVQ